MTVGTTDGADGFETTVPCVDDDTTVGATVRDTGGSGPKVGMVKTMLD